MLTKHRAAARFDTMRQFGLRLSEVQALPSSDAWACLHGLFEDSQTHLYAAATGQTFQGSHADFATVLTAQLLLSMGSDGGKKPPTLPGPFLGAERRKKHALQAQVSQQEKARLQERLRQYSSIPD